MINDTTLPARVALNKAMLDSLKVHASPKMHNELAKHLAEGKQPLNRVSSELVRMLLLGIAAASEIDRAGILLNLETLINDIREVEGQLKAQGLSEATSPLSNYLAIKHAEKEDE